MWKDLLMKCTTLPNSSFFKFISPATKHFTCSPLTRLLLLFFFFPLLFSNICFMAYFYSEPMLHEVSNTNEYTRSGNDTHDDGEGKDYGGKTCDTVTERSGEWERERERKMQMKYLNYKLNPEMWWRRAMFFGKPYFRHWIRIYMFIPSMSMCFFIVTSSIGL